MAMNSAYLNLVANAGAAAITHIGLVNGSGTEISGGTYARQSVSWVPASGGVIRPSGDLTFNIPSGSTVAGWRGYSGSAGGATDYGGSSLTSQTFSSAGTYTLLAASTSITHS